MRIRTSRRYYLPFYVLVTAFLILFPNLVSMLIFLVVLLSIEVYISTRFLEIRSEREIFFQEGIVNRKITRLEKDFLQLVSIEKNPYLMILGLANLRLKTIDKEFVIEGIAGGDKIFRSINKVLRRK
ncbi:MAG: PH domain-containing protein [Candidatus Aenigmatarchaeota archaeon]